MSHSSRLALSVKGGLVCSAFSLALSLLEGETSFTVSKIFLHRQILLITVSVGKVHSPYISV